MRSSKLESAQNQTGASCIRPVGGRTFAPGTRVRLTGTVVNHPQEFGIGGEVPPGGSYMKLARPIFVGGVSKNEVFLGGKAYPAGAKLTLEGNIQLERWGGVETAGGTYAELTDIKKCGPSKG